MINRWGSHDAPMNSRIPKRIIQIWGGGSDLPLHARASAVNLRLLHPEFEYILFDDKRMEEFVDKNFPEYRRVFISFRFPIQRYDFFRYLAIYQLGGFYFDTDVFLATGISDLLDFGCVFPFEELTESAFLREEHGMDWQIAIYGFGAVPEHPFVRAIIENCVRAQRDQEWSQAMMRSIPRFCRDEYHVLNTTGPGLASRTLAEYPDAATQVRVLFPENVCDRKYWNRFGNYGVHITQGSWHERKGFLRKRLTPLWMSWAKNKAVRESAKFGGRRSLEFTPKA
jgi:inositol phosphorylceramide mannosyltransferase catalytic subunit